MRGKKVAIVGGGAWGTTLAILLANKGYQVSLWVHQANLAEEIKSKRENSAYLPGSKIPESVEVSVNLGEATSEADLIILAVASQYLKAVTQDLARLPLKMGTLFLSAVKGLDEETLKRPSQIIKDSLPAEAGRFLAVVSGPNLAKEIVAGLPAATVVAAEDLKVVEAMREYLMSEKFRVYTSTDVVGVELGGALKNIIAIAAGVVEGLGLGDNAKAALIIRGLAEIVRLGKPLGADLATFSGLSGIGDLAVTCYSPLSRNHYVGLQLAKGQDLKTILASMTAVAEGINTCRAAKKLAAAQKVEMPITEQVYDVLFEGKKPHLAVSELMLRSPKHEIW